MSLFLARNGLAKPSHACPLMRAKRTLHGHRFWSVNDPGCVKTCASRECAELFSPLSPVRLCCQCCSFPIQRNRDKISMCKFDVGVFTQPGPKGEVELHRSRSHMILRKSILPGNSMLGAGADSMKSLSPSILKRRLCSVSFQFSFHEASTVVINSSPSTRYLPV